MTIPSEWAAAIQFLAERFTSTAVFASPTFRESELDDILPTWQNREALFMFLEHRQAITPKRAGLYPVTVADPALIKVQLPLSLELRDILPGILELEFAKPAATKTPSGHPGHSRNKIPPKDVQEIFRMMKLKRWTDKNPIDVCRAYIKKEHKNASDEDIEKLANNLKRNLNRY